jgi:hypothetical protein
MNPPRPRKGQDQAALSCTARLRQDGAKVSHLHSKLYNPRPGTQWPLMRPKTKYGFLFEFEIPANDPLSTTPRLDRPMVQFTDDQDLIWKIDDDLRLTRVRQPAVPWVDLLSY